MLSFPVYRNQSGYYWCSAVNGLSVTVNASAYLDVQYKPNGMSFTCCPTNTTVLCGRNMVLSCKTDANPAPHVYHCYFNGTFIGMDNLSKYTVIVQADGVFTCVPLNAVGTGDNTTIAVIAVDAPLVDVFPATTYVKEGNSITLSCNTSGKAAPVIAWTKVGSLQVLSHTSLLSVVNVTRPGRADNMIQYRCTASNGVETPSTATVNITVHYLPKAVALLTTPVNTTVLCDSAVMLKCGVDANPDAYIYNFYFNGNFIGN
ncbi:protein turtle homolog B-like [Stylophora pistillata]|uniref:protein turtle homolog B-like n=1 Tax=Stylophora pistillata TaxID=50429 RepID=UPI000C050D10|nr:protein turtle homolog B-like [Stylophora pistillata]